MTDRNLLSIILFAVDFPSFQYITSRIIWLTRSKIISKIDLNSLKIAGTRFPVL